MMRQIYSFDRYDPPAVTAQSLERIRKKRALERQLLLLSIGALLLEACAMAAVVFLFNLSVVYGLAGAALLCTLQIGGGVILITFRQNQKNAYAPLHRTDV